MLSHITHILFGSKIYNIDMSDFVFITFIFNKNYKKNHISVCVLYLVFILGIIVFCFREFFLKYRLTQILIINISISECAMYKEKSKGRKSNK